MATEFFGSPLFRCDKKTFPGASAHLRLLVSGTLNNLTGNQDLADWVGMGVWILSSILFLMYGQLWFGDPDAFVAKPKPSSVLQQWRHAKDESKLQAAELRCGVVFALIGGVTAAGANASDFLI